MLFRSEEVEADSENEAEEKVRLGEVDWDTQKYIDGEIILVDIELATEE